MAQSCSATRSSITALLGPTNTGKTHRAVERMLSHSSGMIGLPLRLLARELYDRVSVRVGESKVALVTGEEKRIPPRPRYWLCTVEAMPLDRPVDFLAVDEVQLAAHRQRGHVFTDRMLHARGLRETWFLGADTMRPLVEQLLPTAALRRHPRFSKLRHVAPLGLSALPPRTALVAFSAAEVYELAEKLRRRRGGAAVVLGALSPRTRNAQVALYQSGEVSFMVATDAIGMGLNMDVDHVAFASLRKFDGRNSRALHPAELAQIAGRAGRHTRDGSFGTLSSVSLDDDTVFRIESHRFAPVRQLVWRNSDLVFDSLDSLLASLKQRPKLRCLRLVERADDYAALGLLVKRADIVERARGPDAVSLLWDVCQIPDFRKLMTEHHASLLAELYLQLTSPAGKLDPDFMDRRISRLEGVGGDIDTIVMHMEFIRTWSYIAHHAAWIDDAEHWQQRTQVAEDELSDALHNRLIDRFVEHPGGRKAGRGARARSRPRRPPRDSAGDAPGVIVDGPFSKLQALRNKLRSTADDAYDEEQAQWVETTVEAPFAHFRVEPSGAILAGKEELGRLARGGELLRPEVKLTLRRQLGAGARSRLQRRLRAWARDLVQQTTAALCDERLVDAGPALRGLIYQLEQQLGTMAAKPVRPQLRQLNAADRTLLTELDIKLGNRFVYAASMLDMRSVSGRLALCSAWLRQPVLPALSPGAVALEVDRKIEPKTYLAVGYAAVGTLAIRVDVVEDLDLQLRELSQRGPFQVPDELVSSLGCTHDQLEGAIIALGYALSAEGFVWPHKRRSRRGK